MLRRSPSYGRGRNASAYDRLTARESNPATRYFKPGEVLASLRRANHVTANGGRIQLWWGDHDGVDAAAWEREKHRIINERINEKGGQRYSRYNDPHTRGVATCFVRDAFRLRAGTIRQYGFESRACRERLPHLDRDRSA